MFTRLRYKKPQFTNEPRNDFERLSKSIYDYLFGLEAPGVLEFTEARGDFNSLSVGGQGLSHKNRLIGGDFTVNPWQRGTSFAAVATETYTADRWVWNQSGAGVVTIQKTADAPTADDAGYYSQHCLDVDVTTADTSIAAGDFYVLSQRVEGLNAASFGFGQAGERNVTLSFWVKSTKTGVHCVSLRNSAANRAYVAEYTVFASNTWEYKTVTIPVDTSGTWLYDTGIGVTVTWCLAAGSTYQTAAGAWAAGNYVATSSQVNCMDSTSNNFKIALCQLEPGKVATQYEWRSVGTEKTLCQRYLPAWNWQSGNDFVGAGYSFSTTDSFISVALPVTPRVKPTGITVSGTSNFRVANGANVQGAPTALTYSIGGSLSSQLIYATTTAGSPTLAAGDGALLFALGAASIQFTGCEL